MNTPFAFGEEIVVKEFAREDNDFSTSMRTVPNCRAMYTSSIDTPADQQYRITFGRINKLESFGRIVEASDETADGLSPADKDKNKEKDPHVFQSMLVDDKSKLGLDRFPAFNLGNEPPTAPLAFQKRSRPVESKQEHKERVINTIKEQHRELSIKFNGGFLDKKFSKESSNSDGNNSNSNPRQTYFQLPKRKK